MLCTGIYFFWLFIFFPTSLFISLKIRSNELFIFFRCAFLTASLQEYITICLELMGKRIFFSSHVFWLPKMCLLKFSITVPTVTRLLVSKHVVRAIFHFS